MVARSTKQAFLLVVFAVAAIALGIVIGAAVARAQSAGQDGLSQIATGLGVMIIAIPVAAAIGGLIWSFTFKRAWWFPTIALIVLFTIAIFGALSLTTDSLTGYILPILILLAALTATFAIGLYAPPARR